MNNKKDTHSDTDRPFLTRSQAREQAEVFVTEIKKKISPLELEELARALEPHANKIH
jgi:hypothetical protein